MTATELVARRLRLFSRRRVLTLLEGNYDSLFKGKGVELSGLREYVPGDSTKDIDWAATARTNMVQTRLYVPLRDHRFLVAADTSRSMLLPSRGGMSKTEAVLGITVMLGAFVHKNQDRIALATLSGERLAMTTFAHNDKHIERMLKEYEKQLHTPRANRDDEVLAILDDVKHHLRHRTTLFIISDSLTDPVKLKDALLRVRKRQQVFYIHLEPSWPFGPPVDARVLDIETERGGEQALLGNKNLQKEWKIYHATWREQAQNTCRQAGTPFVALADAQEIPKALQNLFLQAKRYARKH